MDLPAGAVVKEMFGFRRTEEFLYQLSNYKLLKKGSVSWKQSVYIYLALSDSAVLL
jgi:hypothetical protein